MASLEGFVVAGGAAEWERGSSGLRSSMGRGCWCRPGARKAAPLGVCQDVPTGEL